MKKSLLPQIIRSCKIKSRKGFTLAEILISLMILGVIAALTIPALIQNTQKKEEVVKIKKGLSVINQALATHYALTGKDLSDYNPYADDENVYYNEIFKKRLSIVEDGFDGDVAFKTADGIIYGYWFSNMENAWIITKQYSYCADYKTAGSDWLSGCQEGTLGNLTGSYSIKCSEHRCVPTEATAAILNAVDPTKSE